jgi:hypothetical protein
MVSAYDYFCRATKNIIYIFMRRHRYVRPIRAALRVPVVEEYSLNMMVTRYIGHKIPLKNKYLSNWGWFTASTSENINPT